MYLWFDFETGAVLTESGRQVDSQPSLTAASDAWPDAVFRVVNLTSVM